jgi:hypothetical protein
MAISSLQLPSLWVTTKPGVLAPGVCLLSRGFVPGVRAQGGWAQLCLRLCLATAVIVCRSGGFQLWAELPALAPGARCRLGRSVGSGAPQAMQWTACVSSRKSHARNIRDPSRVLEQGPDRQRAPDVWCGGVSSINGASESRCHHDGSAGTRRHGQQRDRHRSSPEATGLHEGGFMAQGQAPWAVLAGSPGPAGCCAPAARVWGHRQRRPWRC